MIVFADNRSHACHLRSDRICGSDKWHSPKVRFLLGIAASADSGALDLDSLDLVQKMSTVTKEELIVVASLVLSSSQACKVVKIQLTLERGDLGETEVTGEEFLEELRLVHGEAAPVSLPAYNVRVSIGFDLFQHQEQFHGEAGNKGILLSRVEDEFFLGRGLFLCVIVVVMLNDDELIATFAALGAALGSLRRLLLEGTHVEGLNGNASLFGDAHGVGFVFDRNVLERFPSCRIRFYDLSNGNGSEQRGRMRSLPRRKLAVPL